MIEIALETFILFLIASLAFLKLLNLLAVLQIFLLFFLQLQPQILHLVTLLLVL